MQPAQWRPLFKCTYLVSSSSSSLLLLLLLWLLCVWLPPCARRTRNYRTKRAFLFIIEEAKLIITLVKAAASAVFVAHYNIPGETTSTNKTPRCCCYACRTGVHNKTQMRRSDSRGFHVPRRVDRCLEFINLLIKERNVSSVNLSSRLTWFL